MKLPIKTRILEYVITKDDLLTAQELSETLKKEYGKERTTSIKNIEKQLDMYARVGFLKEQDVHFDENKNVVVTYKVTEAGKKNIKYIPGHGNAIF